MPDNVHPAEDFWRGQSRYLVCPMKHGDVTEIHFVGFHDSHLAALVAYSSSPEDAFEIVIDPLKADFLVTVLDGPGGDEHYRRRI